MGIRSELMQIREDIIIEDIVIYASRFSLYVKLKGNTELGAKTLADFFQLPISIYSNLISATQAEAKVLVDDCNERAITIRKIEN